jgi:hypothetical protein
MKGVVGWISTSEPGGLRVHARGQQTRTFGTMTRDLIMLRELHHSQDMDHVAMESTGVFWQPMQQRVEDTGMNLLVANARRIKAVPTGATNASRTGARWALRQTGCLPDRPRRILHKRSRGSPPTGG